MADKSKKRSFFSLDRHVGLKNDIGKNVGFFKSIMNFIAKTPKRPVMGLSEAKAAWA